MDNSMPVSNSSFNGNCIDNTDMMNQNQLNGTQTIPSPYTFPAILHYLQYEWQKLEQEKQQWMIERAELQAQLTILEGRVMSQFNLKKDLIRRIKMLEYCLRAERAKYHKLKYGVEPPPLHVEDEEFKAEQLNENNAEITTNTSWKKGRHLLRQYLMEIGYTDAIINIRSNRVRYLLGLNAGDEAADANTALKGQPTSVGQSEVDGKKSSGGPFMPASSKFLATETESSVDETIAFLKGQSNSMQNEEVDDDDVIDSETEEVLSEFNFLSAHQSNSTVVSTLASSTANTAAGAKNSHGLDIGELANITPNDEWKQLSDDTKDSKEKTQADLKQALLLGDAQEWNPRFILKSHFDCVRCLKFHSREPLIVTGSDDETVKLWNLNKPPLASNKNKVPTQDLEPIYTFRGHKSPVLSLLIVDYHVFSGGMNGEILVWRIPEDYSSIDPYETYDASLFLGSLDGHTDAVWSLVAVPVGDHPSDSNSDHEDEAKSSDAKSGQQSKFKLICSASADGTIKIWNIQQQTCVKTIVCDENLGQPTCLAALPPNATLDSPSNIDRSAVAETKQTTVAKPSLSQLLAASFSRGCIQLFDLNSSTYSQPVLNLESSKTKNGSTANRINAIVVHPTLTVIVSAHQDRNLRFWDYTTGKCYDEMIAHLDEITCLDIDLEGLYLLSGGHDYSVRLWNFDTKRCIKETKSHIEKFSEAILDVSFHPTLKFFATSGSDAKAICFSVCQ